jgi:glutathione S-transferase
MYQRVFTPMMGAKTDEARVTELAKVLDGKMAAYEAILSKQKYLAGDELTLADLFHLPHGVFLAPQKFNFLEDEARFPHVARCALSCIFTPTRADIQNPIVGGGTHFSSVVAGSQRWGFGIEYKHHHAAVSQALV